MQLSKQVLLFIILTKYIVNNIHISRALNSNINHKNLNLLQPLPEKENFSKGTILLQSSIRSHRAVFVIDMKLLPVRPEIYILHRFLVGTSQTLGVLFLNLSGILCVGLKNLLRWNVLFLKEDLFLLY